MASPDKDVSMTQYSDAELDRAIDSVPGIILDVELDELAGGKPFEEIAADSAELAGGFDHDK